MGTTAALGWPPIPLVTRRSLSHGMGSFLQTGGCPEDCGYCAQSSKHAKSVGLKAEKLVDLDYVYHEALKAREGGSTRFCMGAAWRGPSQASPTPLPRSLIRSPGSSLARKLGSSPIVGGEAASFRVTGQARRKQQSKQKVSMIKNRASSSRCSSVSASRARIIEAHSCDPRRSQQRADKSGPEIKTAVRRLRNEIDFSPLLQRWKQRSWWRRAGSGTSVCDSGKFCACAGVAKRVEKHVGSNLAWRWRQFDFVQSNRTGLRVDRNGITYLVMDAGWLNW